MIRVPVNPDIVIWAREYSGLSQEDLLPKFKKLPEWEKGQLQPTLKQAEAYARRVQVPFGYLFASEIPNDTIPIMDFRTFTGREVTSPSQNLLDTIYSCQERQSWYSDFARATGEPKRDFVNSVSLNMSCEIVAAGMRQALNFDITARENCATWTEAMMLLKRRADEIGVLIMVNGIVANNTHRKLDAEEFRGFAMCDSFAPLIFVNGADTTAAQMWTVALELAHIWLGCSGLSNVGIVPVQKTHDQEVWCDAVAAELLVPLHTLRSELKQQEKLSDTLSRLAHTFKVSTLIILRRLLDAQYLSRDQFNTAWSCESQPPPSPVISKSGGGFYRTIQKRVGHRFARALIGNTLEGQTLYRDAFRMLGIQKTSTFNQIARELGLTP